MNTSHLILQQRARVARDLLPDLCIITPMAGTNPHIVDGILVQDAPVPRTYKGSTNIPCRMDISRAFRPDKFKTQATTVDEYTFETAVDVTILATDIITVRGRRFVIRKIKSASNWDVTIEATVVELDTTIDNN